MFGWMSKISSWLQWNNGLCFFHADASTGHIVTIKHVCPQPSVPLGVSFGFACPLLSVTVATIPIGRESKTFRHLVVAFQS